MHRLVMVQSAFERSVPVPRLGASWMLTVVATQLPSKWIRENRRVASTTRIKVAFKEILLEFCFQLVGLMNG